MCIRLKKKVLFIVLILILILLGLVGTGCILFKHENQNNVKFEKLFEYCDSQEVSKGQKQNCKIFLADFYKDNENKSCLQFTLPVIEADQRELEICLEEDVVVNWENPYGNYRSNIPVIVNLFYKKNFLFLDVKQVDMELMSDEDARAIADPVNRGAKDILNFISAEAMKEYLEEGFVLGETLCDDGQGICTRITVHDVEIIDYYFEEDEVVFDIEMRLYQEKRRQTIKTKEVQFQELTYSGDFIEFADLNVKSDLESFPQKNNIYTMDFLLKGKKIFTEDLIQEYVESDNAQLDFILDMIISYVEE